MDGANILFMVGWTQEDMCFVVSYHSGWSKYIVYGRLDSRGHVGTHSLFRVSDNPAPSTRAESKKSCVAYNYYNAIIIDECAAVLVSLHCVLCS